MSSCWGIKHRRFDISHWSSLLSPYRTTMGLVLSIHIVVGMMCPLILHQFNKPVPICTSNYSNFSNILLKFVNTCTTLLYPYLPYVRLILNMTIAFFTKESLWDRLMLAICFMWFWSQLKSHQLLCSSGAIIGGPCLLIFLFTFWNEFLLFCQWIYDVVCFVFIDS